MFFSAVLRTSRTTYRGSRGSGSGASAKTSFRSSPASRSTLRPSVLAGHNFKRAQRGLFDGALPQSGNTIPKSRQKTGRTWRPNVQNRVLHSYILGKPVNAKVTTRALRTIRKYGGLDQYIAQRDSSILGQWGRELRSEMAAVAVEKGEVEQRQSDRKQARIKLEKKKIKLQSRIRWFAARKKKRAMRKAAQLGSNGDKGAVDPTIVAANVHAETTQSL